VAFEYAGRPRAMKLSRGWTRIGRSAAADIRLDDATVSRRHALIVHTDEGMRVLDDRSLNGLFVNGERVDWAPLSDGDELEIGRYRLYVIAAA
jgi:pSer/pThr/pTyr-binding forkhead associated (FHA) protein